MITNMAELNKQSTDQNPGHHQLLHLFVLVFYLRLEQSFHASTEFPTSGTGTWSARLSPCLSGWPTAWQAWWSERQPPRASPPEPCCRLSNIVQCRTHITPVAPSCTFYSELKNQPRNYSIIICRFLSCPSSPINHPETVSSSSTDISISISIK